MTWPTGGPDPSWSDVFAVIGAGLRDRMEMFDREPAAPGTCRRAPLGWYCSLSEGHQGPCPAWPAETPEVDPFPPDLRDALLVLRLVARHCLVLASYEVRPFDMLADRRRWRWQRRHPCQYGDGLPAVLAAWRRDGK